MTLIAFIFLTVLSFLLLAVPNKYAPAVLLSGFCYMTKGSGIDIGPFFITIYRLLLVVGLLRAFFNGDLQRLQISPIDKLVGALLTLLFLCSFFHDPSIGSGPVSILGPIFDIGACYALFRAWTEAQNQIDTMLKSIVLISVPIAVFMTIELVTRKNAFSIFGGVPIDVVIRDGRLRAQGPFRHPILAGTVGAAILPYALSLFKRDKLVSLVGTVSATAMVFASASSGPILAGLAGVFGIYSFRWRRFFRPLMVFGMILFVILSFTREKSPIYLIARIDVTGSSTGYHRALLIDQTFKHIDEWWLYGTDRTVHWMPGQGRISDYHTDITNYYISFAVGGGLLSLITIVLIIKRSFDAIGRAIRSSSKSPGRTAQLWALGSALFSHVMSSFSVAYFDQSMVFFWMAIALIVSATFPKQSATISEKS